jgi:DNA-directed RNA polymerase specialized sigma24 family protein
VCRALARPHPPLRHSLKNIEPGTVPDDPPALVRALPDEDRDAIVQRYWRRDTPERSAEVLRISSVELKERENNALDYLEPHLSSRMRSDSFDAILPTRLPKRVKSSAAP